MDNYILAKYIRLSNEDTKSDSMSIENQRIMLDRYIADMEVPNIKVLEFVDNGYSGTNFERPGIQKLLDLVRDGRINCILVKDFSRFGRNAIETGYFIERVFPLYRTRFVSLTDYYDSNEYEGGTGGIEVALKFLVHEHYSRDLSRKIKASRRERSLRGEHISKNCAFGYQKTLDNRMEIEPESAETVRLIFKLAAEGESLAMIERELYERKRPTPAVVKKIKRTVTKDVDYDYIWEKSVLQKILRDEQYTGTYVAGKTAILEAGSRVAVKMPESEWIRIPNHHPAIVSSELFEKVQTIINMKGEPLRKRALGTNMRYAECRQSPLKGKVVCGGCGHTMTLSTTKNSQFQCLFTRSAPDKECHGLRIPKQELESAVYTFISKQAATILKTDHLNEVSIKAPAGIQQSECKHSIEKNGEAKRDLYERFILGEVTVDEYKAQKAGLDKELDRLSRAYTSQSERLLQEQKEAETARKLGEIHSESDGLSREIVDMLVEKVCVYPDKSITVAWNIGEANPYNQNNA